MNRRAQELIVADTGHNKLEVFSLLNGSHKRTLGSMAKLKTPTDVVRDQHGLLYVTCSDDNSIKILRDADWKSDPLFMTVALCTIRPESPLSRLPPRVLEIILEDGAEAWAGYGPWLQSRCDGTLLRTIGSCDGKSSKSEGKFHEPRRIVLDQYAENMFVADCQNARVQVRFFCVWE